MATKAAKAPFLSDEWFEQVGALARGGAATGLTAQVQGVVSGGPEGEIKCRIVFDGGALAAVETAGVEVGRADAADVTLTAMYDDAVAIQKGELAPSVAYMQGRLKTAGDTGLVLDVLSFTASPEYDRLREQADAVTQY